jgi:hypothetical protein
MVPLSVWTHAGSFILGAALVGTAWNVIEERNQLRRDSEEQKAVIAQEKKNAEATAEFVRDIQTIHLHYQHNPVRVLLRPKAGEPTSCPDVRAEDVILTVGGVKGGIRAATP